MSALPAAWASVPLRQIAKCQGGSAFSPSLQGRRTGEIPFFKVSDMNRPENSWAMVVANNSVDHTDLSAISGHQKPAGSVIFPKVGGAIHTDKKRLLARPSLIDNNLMAVWPIDEDVCRSAFLFVYFQSVRLSSLANPGPLPSINNARLYELTIPVPPIGEQEKIVAVLWKLQRAIAAQDALIAATRDLKHSAMTQLFTRGLRTEHEENVESGSLPSNWVMRFLGDFGRVGNGSTPKKDKPEYWAGGTIPWLTSAKIHEGVIREADQYVTERAVAECHLPRVPKRSLLIAITGQGKTLGNAALVDFDTTISQHLAYVRFDSSDVVPEYVYHFMRSRYEELQSIGRAGGSTKAALTCAVLRDYRVPCPPLPEQQKIAAALGTIDRKLDHHQRKRAALGDLFETMLHKLMTAEIRVADLDIDTSEVATSTEGGEHK